MGSVPGSERSPGGGHGSSLRYSLLENPMDRGASWATIHGVKRVEHKWSDLAAAASCNYSCPLVLSGDCFQDPWGYQNPQLLKSFLLNGIKEFTLLCQVQPTWAQICDAEPVVWRVDCVCTCACIIHFIQCIFFFCCFVFTCPCLSLSLFFEPKFYHVKEN